MKTAFKKLFCLMLVAMLLVSAVPAAFATETADSALFWIQANVDGEGKYSEQMTLPVNPDEATIIAYARADSDFASFFATYSDFEVVEKTSTSAAINFKSAPAVEEEEEVPTPTVPENNQPETNRPGTNRPGNNQPETNRPGNNQPETNRPGNNQPETNRPGTNFPGANVPGTNFPGHNQPGHNFKPGDFPGNGHNRPNFNWETVQLTVVYNFPDNHRYMGRTSETFTVWKGSDILDALNAAESMGYYDVPTRDGYTMAGYSFDKECKNDVNRDDEINSDLTIYCEWEKSKVTLRVYTNDDTRHPDKTLSLDSYAYDGKITRTEVEKLLNTKYTAKSGYTLAYYGLFTAKTWNNGRFDKDDAVSSINVGRHGETVIFVMVKNVKANSNADTTNPKTGDNIMIAVTTLAISAAALVSVMELKKRKMI